MHDGFDAEYRDCFDRPAKKRPVRKEKFLQVGFL
jgi:hypothetical protein